MCQQSSARCLSMCRWWGCCWRSIGRGSSRCHLAVLAHRAAAEPEDGGREHGVVRADRGADGAGLARARVPGPVGAAGFGAAAAGAAPSGRRHRVALHLRPTGPARAPIRAPLGIRIAFSTTAVVLAQSFVSLPFLVVSLEGALRTAGGEYESHRRDAGCAPDHRVAQGDGAAGGAGPGVRGGARVRPLARRVRGHPDLRGLAARVSPGPCRWRSTCSAKPIPTPRSRCRCCWLWSPHCGHHLRRSPPGWRTVSSLRVQADLRPARRRVRPRPCRRRGAGRARAQRRRQIHAAAVDRRAAATRRGQDRTRRPGCSPTPVPAFRPCALAAAWRMLSQRAMLFPHLSVAANVAFAPRCKGKRRRQARVIAEHGSPPSTPRTWPTVARRNCREARRSASPSPARWPPNHSYCS